MTSAVKELRPDLAAALPMRPVRLGPRDVVIDRRPGGTIHLRSPHALAPYPAKLTERLDHWAATAPERTFMAQRDAAGGWRKLSYRETLSEVRRIGAAFVPEVRRKAGTDLAVQEHPVGRAVLLEVG